MSMRGGGTMSLVGARSGGGTLAITSLSPQYVAALNRFGKPNYAT